MTPKQQRFVEEYLVDLNATQAAVRAGYSEKTAEQQGCRLLRNTQVAAAVQQAQQARSERTETTADDVLRELGALAFSDMAHYIRFDEGGDILLDFSQMPEGEGDGLRPFDGAGQPNPSPLVAGGTVVDDVPRDLVDPYDLPRLDPDQRACPSSHHPRPIPTTPARQRPCRR